MLLKLQNMQWFLLSPKTTVSYSVTTNYSGNTTVTKLNNMVSTGFFTQALVANGYLVSVVDQPVVVLIRNMDSSTFIDNVEDKIDSTSMLSVPIIIGVVMGSILLIFSICCVYYFVYRKPSARLDNLEEIMNESFYSSKSVPQSNVSVMSSELEFQKEIEERGRTTKRNYWKDFRYPKQLGDYKTSGNDIKQYGKDLSSTQKSANQNQFRTGRSYFSVLTQSPSTFSFSSPLPSTSKESTAGNDKVMSKNGVKSVTSDNTAAVNDTPIRHPRHVVSGIRLDTLFSAFGARDIGANRVVRQSSAMGQAVRQGGRENNIASWGQASIYMDVEE